MILIIAQHDGTHLSSSTRELVTAAQNIENKAINILIIGHQIQHLAREAAPYADQVLVADHPTFAHHDPQSWTAAITHLAHAIKPQVLLFTSTRRDRAYAPRIAVTLNAAYWEHISHIEYNHKTRQAERVTHLGRVIQTISTEADCIVTTVAPGAFAEAEQNKTHGSIDILSLPVIQSHVRISDRQVTRGTHPLQTASIVVTGGRGLGSAERFEKLVEGLANALGAGVGATRAVVDAGWRPYAEQVGQTGKTVQPAVYLALGSSGAVQHLSGMNKSGCVIAINKDPHAPIWKAADYGVLGDVGEIVPALIDALKAGR